MRTLIFFSILVGVLSQVTVNAQAPDTRFVASQIDLSGVYAAVYVRGAPSVTMPDVYPFTAEGELAHSAYDPLVSSTRVLEDCAPETVPAVLWSTNPMQIAQENGRIVFSFEEGNTTRSIPLARPTAQSHTELGNTVGYWVGGVLTIETTRPMAGFIFHGRGFPISQEARLTERYWRAPGENDLRMELLVDDPVNYREPLKFGRRWVWSPDDQVRPWECVSLGPRDSEPTDIDGLARMLEEL